jgi:hypothetical protein
MYTKTIIVTLTLFVTSIFFAQNKDNDTSFISGMNYLIYKKSKSGAKLKSADLVSLVAPLDKAIFFFYPEIDSSKRKSFDDQIKELASSTSIVGSKIIGIPFVEAKTDDANVKLDDYIITGIQCVIYTKDDRDLKRSLKLNSEIVIDSIGLPSLFYRIDVDKEELCVKDNRIIFFEKIISEFLSPKLNEEEKLDQIMNNQLLMLEKISLLNSQIDKMKKEVLDLKKQIEVQSNPGSKRLN